MKVVPRVRATTRLNEALNYKYASSRTVSYNSPLLNRRRATSSLKWPVVVASGVSCLYLLHPSIQQKALSTHRNDGKPDYISTATTSSAEYEGNTHNKGGWSVLPASIKDLRLPQWASAVPGFVDKLQNELKGAEGTLADDIWKEAQDPKINPEIAKSARVRVSSAICEEEKRFLSNRKPYTRKALAKYLDIPEKDIHPDDIPIIGMCGSGGGLRALVAGASSYYSTQEAGLYDCITYTAGVSGSCWLQSLYYSSITGQSFTKLLDHLKDRIGTHIAFPPAILKLLTSSPTHKFLLSGGYEKYRGYDGADFGLVDIYGVLLGGRLLIPKGDLAVDNNDLKLSTQVQYVDKGQHPLPIYTAVRHEIPEDQDDTVSRSEMQEQAKAEHYFQWFEFTPYELWCEEFSAGIPTWSVGREFSEGKSLMRDNGLSLPEIRVPLLMGIFGSAFCATLSHYYHEVRPLIRGLTGFGGLDEAMQGRNDDLVKLHPVQPAAIPNFLREMKDILPESCPKSIHSTSKIELMDAGMSNNLPIYPLLRPGRDVDIVIAFDASADIKDDNWLRVADGYARQREIKGWPIGTGWPENGENTGSPDIGKELDNANTTSTRDANTKVEEANNEQNIKKPSQDITDSSLAEKQTKHESTELGYCNVWVGTTEERSSQKEPPKSKLVEEDWELMTPDAGIAVVYFPFMANPKVKDVDPNTSDFMSTWNFIYTPEQIDSVVSLARQNFEEGREKVKMTVRAVYERKKKQRLEREKNERWSWKIAK